MGDRFVVGGGDLCAVWFLEKGAFAEGAIGFEGDVVFLAKVEELFLIEVRMELDLIDLGVDECGVKILEVVDGAVADAKGADEAGIEKGLHGSDHLDVGAIALGPMEEIKIEVVGL